MWNIGEICSHLSNIRIKALIEHLLQIIVLPPWLCYVVIGENLSAGGGKKPCAKNIQVHLGTIPRNTHEWVVVFIGCRLTAARHLRVVQSQSGCVIAEGKHNMDKAD